MFDILVLELKDSNPELFERLADELNTAFVMGKRMGNRLVHYKHAVDAKADEDAKAHDDLPARHKMRRQRIEKLRRDENLPD